MSDLLMLEQRLTALGEELRGGAGFEDSIMRRLTAERQIARRPEAMVRPRGVWKTLAAVAACLCVAFGVWSALRPATLHARVLAALAKVRTVHATGWSRQIVRKWPLEKPLPADASTTEKYATEFWYWNNADGLPCSYEKVGPVVAVRHGGDLTEFQGDADLTFRLSGGAGKDGVARFERLAEVLSALQRPSLKKEELGTREEDGRSLRGVRLTQGDEVEEIWLDARTDLPARMTRSLEKSGEKTLELRFAVDEGVPQLIADYRPPRTRLVRGGSGGEQQLRWREHVAEVERSVLAKPMEGSVGIVPRADGETFSVQYAMQMPSGRYTVVPLDVGPSQKLTPACFVRFYAADGGGARDGSAWRLPKESRDLELVRSDLVYEDGTPWHEWAQLALGQFGLEFEDVTEMRSVWVAKQDGRPLKDWRQVKPPVPYLVEAGIEKKGVVRLGIGHMLRPVTMKELIEDFNAMIDSEDLAADKPWIIDDTGLPVPPKYDEKLYGTPEEYRKNVVDGKFLVATDAPYFVGRESLEMARKWYEKEFGITFHEERRPVTVHVVRKKR